MGFPYKRALMAEMATVSELHPLPRHILGMEGVPKPEIELLLDLS